MDIAFIGFGGAAYGIAKGLRREGIGNIFFHTRSWATPPYDEVIAKRAAETGAVLKKSMEELVRSADIIFSCVTGSVTVAMAETTAPYLHSGQLYVDLNTTKPEDKKMAAEIVQRSGAFFVDAAMMGGIPTYLHRVPIFASGAGARRFRDTFQPFGMQIEVIGPTPGQASAIKMFRSIFMKGLLALLLEVMDASKKYKATETVLSSISETMDRTQFLETARLVVTKGVVNPERMAHEMEDVIKTLELVGASTIMSTATREKLEWCARYRLRERFAGEIPQTLTEVLELII